MGKKVFGGKFWYSVAEVVHRICLAVTDLTACKTNAEMVWTKKEEGRTGKQVDKDK